MPVDILSFRCKHRHTAESHPQCWARYQKGETKSLFVSRPRHTRPAKTLLLDIETRPMKGYFWHPKQEYIQPDMVEQDWSCLCWGAKWLFENEIFGERVTVQEAHTSNDTSILEPIWKLMNEADIVVTQNGVNFDHKKLNTRFIENRFPPPARFLKVDTLITARSVFGWSYNRLDELGQKLGIGKKIDMSFVDWRNCLSNDEKADVALDHMLTYCKRDIAPLLEDVYLAMLPYMDNHPNMNVFSDNDTDICRNCGSEDLFWGEKPYVTPQGSWMSWRCLSCGATGRGTRKEHKIRSTGIK